MRWSFWGLGGAVPSRHHLLAACGTCVSLAVAGLVAWQLASLGGLPSEVSASASPPASPGSQSPLGSQSAAGSPGPGGGDHSGTGTRPSGGASARSTTTKPPPPLTVTRVTPPDGTTKVPGTVAITVSFSAPLSPSSPRPTLSPAVPGTWTSSSADTLSFSPAGGYMPDVQETLTVPGGSDGALASDGSRLAKPFVSRFTVADGSTLRLQELLSLLGYSPLSFTPAAGHAVSPTDAAAQVRAAYSPPAGTFAWRHGGWPSSLVSLWQEGSYNVMTKGLVMSFEADHHLAVDGIAGQHVWNALLGAVAHHQLNTSGYNYAVGSKDRPESLTIWHDGVEVFHSLANTGIAASPTADGTFPVYERLRRQVMRGTNPDGTRYADPVQYVAYFNGGDAVHYLPRDQYGTPQSLGCIELPLEAAAQAWPWLAYGTLVTVTG